MPLIPKTIKNPYGLTIKQQAVINDIICNISQGKGFNLTTSVIKFYRVKKIETARSIASENLSKPNFREALLNGLKDNKIIGKDSLIERRLSEGLDAVVEIKNNTNMPVMFPDYKIRLDYIKEIIKMIRLY